MNKPVVSHENTNKFSERLSKAFCNSAFLYNLRRLFGKKPTTKKGAVIKVTTRIAYSAVLCSLAILFNVITFYPVKYFALSFTVIPCFLAGIILGPISGFSVGFLGDLLGWIIMPQGAYLPLVGIASGLWGFIPGFIFLLFKGHDFIKILVSFVFCLAVCTAGLNTFNLWLVYSNGKTSFWAYLWIRLPFQFAVAAINFFLFTLIYRELAKAKIIKISSINKQNRAIKAVL